MGFLGFFQFDDDDDDDDEDEEEDEDEDEGEEEEEEDRKGFFTESQKIIRDSLFHWALRCSEFLVSQESDSKSTPDSPLEKGRNW